MLPRIRDNYSFPTDPEGIRDAKGELSSAQEKGWSYKPTVHQAKLSAQVNLPVIRQRSASYRRLEDAPHLVGIPEARARAALGLHPCGRMGLRPVAEPGVLAPAVGHDGDEAPAVGGDVAHGLLGAQLGVRHVQEVGPTHERPQIIWRSGCG